MTIQIYIKVPNLDDPRRLGSFFLLGVNNNDAKNNADGKYTYKIISYAKP